MNDAIKNNFVADLQQLINLRNVGSPCLQQNVLANVQTHQHQQVVTMKMLQKT